MWGGGGAGGRCGEWGGRGHVWGGGVYSGLMCCLCCVRAHVHESSDN